MKLKTLVAALGTVGMFALPGLASAAQCTDAAGSVFFTGNTCTVNTAIPCANPAGGCPCAGGPGNDTIIGSPVADVIQGGGGDDIIVGIAGNDLICSGEGNDIVDAGVGGFLGPVPFDDPLHPLTNQVRLGPGDDFAVTGISAVTYGGDGSDTVVGGPFDDLVFALAGNDIVAGGGGNDNLIGGPGDDVLIGQEGLDSLQGGAGNDLCIGGDGPLDNQVGCERFIQ